MHHQVWIGLGQKGMKHSTPERVEAQVTRDEVGGAVPADRYQLHGGREDDDGHEKSRIYLKSRNRIEK